MYYNEYAYKAQPHQMVTYKAITLKSNALHLHTIMCLRQLHRWNQVKNNNNRHHVALCLLNISSKFIHIVQDTQYPQIQ